MLPSLFFLTPMWGGVCFEVNRVVILSGLIQSKMDCGKICCAFCRLLLILLGAVEKL